MLRYISRSFLAVVFGALALPMGANVALGAEAYHLGVSDRIAIKVVEWLPGQATFKSWDAINGEYAISPTGSVAVPFLGEAPAGGKTTAELAADFSGQLTQLFGLTTPPDVTIEIVSFGPIYVVGDVTTSGAYPFSPDLNVIKATSLAGGGMNSQDSALGNTRELISTRGAFLAMQERLQRLIATRARLDAELSKQAEIVLPADFAQVDVADAGAIVSAEQAVLNANTSRAQSQEASLTEYAGLLDQELTTLEQKRVSAENQLDLARQELATIQSLADSGLAANNRVSAVQQTVADLETRLLDISTASLRAQRDSNDTDRNILSLDGTRTADLTVQRQQVDGQIAELQVQMDTQQSLISASLLKGGRDGVDTLTYNYTIIRGTDEIAATETTPVQPGDVIKVELVIAELDANS